MLIHNIDDLPLVQLQKVELDDIIIGKIITFPDGSLKPNHQKIEKNINQTAKQIKIYEFFYRSNNYNVKAYFLQPVSNTNKKLIFFNRSGTGEFGAIEKHTLFTNFFGIQSLLQSGYSILISQLPGVDGGTGFTDACGQIDLDSINDLYKIFSNYSQIDINNIGMIGGSSGGLLTYQSAKYFPWLKAGVIIASPVDDKLSLWERGTDLKSAKAKHYNITDLAELEFRSPIKWVDKIASNTPILIMHGTADWRVDVMHSLKMASKLYEHQKPFRLKIFEGGDHSLREFQHEVVGDIIYWFDTFVSEERVLPNLEKHGI